jgi:hypothetical protein
MTSAYYKLLKEKLFSMELVGYLVRLLTKEKCNINFDSVLA